MFHTVNCVKHMFVSVNCVLVLQRQALEDLAKQAKPC